MLILYRSSPWYGAVALGLCYCVCATLTVAFTRFDGGVAFIWVSSGLLLARLSHLPIRHWLPPIATCGLAALVICAVFGLGARAAPIMTLVNLSEPVLAALVLRRFVGRSIQTDTVRAISWFVLAAGVLAPAVSGIGGAATVSSFTHAPFTINWLNWFAAHGLGALLVTPLTAAWMSGDALRWQRDAGAARTYTTLLMLALVVAVTAIVFSQNRLPILFLPMLPMVFATICGGRLGAIASTIILALIAGVFSAGGAGPVHLIQASTGTRSIFLQAYIAYAALLVLPIAAILKQRAALTARLLESEARYRGIADSLGDAVVDVATDGIIRYASPATAALTGQSPDVLIGANVRILVHDEDVELVWQAHEAALASPGHAFTVQFRGRGKVAEHWFEVAIRAILSSGNEALGLVGSIRDISARKAAEQMLQHEAQTDVLTGLPNRRAFQAMLSARIEEEGKGAGRHCLAIFDLDRFKAINDTHGHGAGDAVLIAVGKAVQGDLRAQDRIGRIGGEEFAVLFHVSESEDATAAAERLQRTIRDLRIPYGDLVPLSVTASMGLCAVLPFSDIDQLMARADQALYEAKRSGRDCFRIAA